MSLLRWKVRVLVTILVILIPLTVYGVEDFERVCEEEILKEDFNISIVQDSCFKTANYYFKLKDFNDASWYYLLSDINKTIKLKPYINTSSSVIYANIAHAYLLNGDLKQAKEYYKKFIQIYHQPQKGIEEDFRLLSHIYTQKISFIIQGKKIWKKLYKKLKNVDTLYDKYKALEKLRDYREMIVVLKKIISIKEQSIIKDSLSIKIEYNNLGSAYYHIDNYPEAFKYYKKALKIEENKLDKNNPNIAISYNNLGALYYATDNQSKALTYYRKALKINKKNYGKNSIQVAGDYNNISLAYKRKGYFDKALEIGIKSLNIYKKNLNPIDIKIAISSNNLSTIYQKLGEYKKALQYSLEALNIYTKLSINNEDLGAVYHTLGSIYEDISNPEKALESYNMALKCYLPILTKNHSKVAILYNNIGSLYNKMNSYDLSIKYYHLALEIYKNLSQKNNSSIGSIYNNLGAIYVDIGKYKKAFKYYNYALKQYESLADKDYLGIATTYDNIGALYETLNDYNKSLEYHLESLHLNKTILGEEHIEIATNYNNLGLLYSSMGNQKKAEFFHKKALQLSKAILGANHIKTGISYYNLSLLYIQNKQYLKAYSHMKLFFDIFLKERNNSFKILNSLQKQQYLKYAINIDDLFKLSATHLQNIVNVNNKNFNFWLNYKGTLFEYQNILSMIKNNPKTSKATKKLIEELNHTNIRLSKAQNKKEIEALEEQIHTIEVNLSKQNELFKSMLQLNNINSSQIAKTLKPNQLYIDFARGNDNYYIFTLDHQNLVTFQEIDANQTKLIDQYIKAYRDNCSYMAKNLKTITANQEQQSIKEAQRVLSKLYDVIVKEYLPTQLKDVSQLIISSDGLLNYFPFEALYHKGHYFVENHTINYISSGKEFIRQTKLYKKDPKKSMTIFANANYDAIVKAPMLFGNPHKEKIEKIFSNLGRSEIDIVKKYYPNATVFEENNATIANLVTTPSSKILHISTHGLLLKDKTIKNPMLKSVLLFAGANQNQKKSTISALRLSTLDLHNTELVVLSACQSGLGEIHQAEGVVGLPKALLQAGAKNVIMSLWTVSNVESAKLMDYFYGNISKGLSYSKALQQAKLSMIKMHPYFWSAFVLSGL